MRQHKLLTGRKTLMDKTDIKMKGTIDKGDMLEPEATQYPTVFGIAAERKLKSEVSADQSGKSRSGGWSRVGL